MEGKPSEERERKREGEREREMISHNTKSNEKVAAKRRRNSGIPKRALSASFVIFAVRRGIFRPSTKEVPPTLIMTTEIEASYVHSQCLWKRLRGYIFPHFLQTQ